MIQQKQTQKNAFISKKYTQYHKKTIISKVLADAEIIHKEFTLIKYEAENYCQLKISIRIKNSQRNEIEKIN